MYQINKKDLLGFLVVIVILIVLLQPQTQKALVTEVVDGDTITVAGGLRIRLIGIDAPESDEDYYTEAKEYLEDKLLNKNVGLEKDVTDKDIYTRLLRYVWLNNSLVNAEIVRSGWAIAKQYEPDIKYQSIIAEAEQEAINNKIGIWASKLEEELEKSEPEIISYLDAGNYIGQIKTVEGTIVTTFKYIKGNIIFLNFHDPYQGYFTAIIWEQNWNKFSFAPEVYYKGKKVRVTGEIIDYKGTPEIVVSDPSQIEIV